MFSGSIFYFVLDVQYPTTTKTNTKCCQNETSIRRQIADGYRKDNKAITCVCIYICINRERRQRGGEKSIYVSTYLYMCGERAEEGETQIAGAFTLTEIHTQARTYGDVQTHTCTRTHTHIFKHVSKNIHMQTTPTNVQQNRGKPFPLR